MAVNLTKENFETEVIKSDLPVLVDFWAPWCGPCRMIAPIVDEIAKEYAGKIKVCKLNIDDSPELASQFGVMSIPTMIIFDKGKVVNKSVGVLPKEKLAELIDSCLKW